MRKAAMNSLVEARSCSRCAWLLPLVFAGCGDVPSIGATRCDFVLAACGETFVGELDAPSVTTFELKAQSKVAPRARVPVGDCSNWLCTRSARVLPGPAGDVWLALSYQPGGTRSSDDPWLVRIGPDGKERERVPRGEALLGFEPAPVPGDSGDIVFDDGAGGVALLRAGAPPTVYLQRAGEPLSQRTLEPLKTTGARYTAPAWMSDGSLRMREQLPGEAPTSLVVVALQPDGSLQWRRRYAPEVENEDRIRSWGEPVLPEDPASAPLRGFVFEGDRYALVSAVEASWSPTQALVSFDAQGNFIGALGHLQVEGQALRMAVSATHFAYAPDTLTDQGGALLLYSAQASELKSPGITSGEAASGRRTGYYDGAAQALALDPEGGKLAVSIAGDYLAPTPVVCQVPAGGGAPACSEIVLCEGELDTLVWPFVSPAGSGAGRVLDGSALALSPDVLAVRIVYTCADAEAAAVVRESPLFDVYFAVGLAGAPVYASAGEPEGREGDWAVDPRRYAYHDELVFLDLSTRVALEQK
jgi:hypothetical protein